MKRCKNQKALATMIALTLTVGGTSTSFAADQIDYDDGLTHTVDLSNQIVTADSEHGPYHAVYAGGEGTIITAPGEVNILYTTDDPAYISPAVSAQFQGKINLGDENTKTVNVTSEGTNARGLHDMDRGQISANGENLTIKANATGEGDDSGFASGIFAYSGGIRQSSGIALVTINAENTTINATSADSNLYQGEYKAAAIAAHNGGAVIISNNLTVNGNATNPYKVTAVSTRGNGSVNINQDGNGTVKINGNIAFGSHYYDVYPAEEPEMVNNSVVNINLSDADSYLNGNAEETGEPLNPENIFHETFNLKLSNGATWSTNANSIVNNLTLKNNGRVNLTGNNNTLTIKNSLNSDNGLVTTDSLSNKMKLADGVNNDGIMSLTTQLNGATADDMKNNPNLAQQIANIAQDNNGATIATNVVAPEGVINGTYNGTVNADGTVTGHYATNNSNRAFVNQAALNLITWRQENNDLNKRLGEVRNSIDDDGVWFRMNRGEVEHKDIHNQYNYYQLGYDRKIGNNWILGGAFSYTDGQSYHGYGTATNKHTGFAAYGSQLNKDGSYIDLIAKYSRLKNKFDLTGGIGHGSYDNNAFALSAEYGKRFTGNTGFWIEPQVELTYGYVDSADFNTRNGAHVSQDSMDSLVGRIGFSVGKNIKAGNVYARVSFLDDFQGDISTDLSRNGAYSTLKDDIGGTWWEYGIGANLNLAPNTHFYLDLERAQGGDVDTNWQWNAGFRYDF